MGESHAPSHERKPKRPRDPAQHHELTADFADSLTIVLPEIGYCFEIRHQATTRPEIQIRVDVRTASLGDDRHEVVLDINVEAKAEDSPVFLVELAYGGLFELANIPADGMQMLLQVECPRLLFPFARRVVADATRDGGFPPLMIDPIDFFSLYRRKMQAAGRSGRIREISP